MGYPKAYIDAMLLNWGDRLFQEPFRHVGAPRLSRATMRGAAARMRDQLARTLRRTPEVMVKITNKASSAVSGGANPTLNGGVRLSKATTPRGAYR